MVSTTNTKQQLLRFTLTGILAVGTDFTTYWLMIEEIPVDIAKACSFILGSIVAFFMNKLWTFNDDAEITGSIFNFTALYSLTFMANVGVNHIVLILIPDINLLGFLCATGTSTVLNFLGMKYWVFSKPQHQAGS